MPHAHDAFAALFAHDFLPLARRAGAESLGLYLTTQESNNFAHLPVRQGETALGPFCQHRRARAFPQRDAAQRRGRARDAGAGAVAHGPV